MQVDHQRMIALSGHKSSLAPIDITVRTMPYHTLSTPRRSGSVWSVRVGTQSRTRVAEPFYNMGGVGLQQLCFHAMSLARVL